MFALGPPGVAAAAVYLRDRLLSDAAACCAVVAPLFEPILAPVRPQLDEAMAWARLQWASVAEPRPAVASGADASEDSEEEMEERGEVGAKK